MSNSKLLNLTFIVQYQCTPVKRLLNWSELFKNHQIELSLSTPSTIVIGDSIAAGPAHFSDVWHNFFCNTLDLGIGGDRTEHEIWRVDNLSFLASIKYVIIHCGTNNIKFNNPTDIANGILCVYFLIQSKLPNAQIIVTCLFPRSQKFSYFRQIVNDVNIELGNACSLYQIFFLNPMMIGYKEMENSILSCFGTMIYIILKLVIKKLQLYYSILFHRATHLNQHHSI